MITSIRNATNEEWDYFVDSVESAIYFQTREWFDIWSEYAGFKSDTKLICFDSGKKVLLPLAHLSLLHGLVKAYFLTPKGLGGFVTHDELTVDEKTELFPVLNKIPMLFGAVNPYDSLTNEFPRINGEDVTQVVDLDRDFATIFRTWSAGHYMRTKKGLREGITVEPAVDEHDWKSYFTIYQDNLARWGNTATNKYSWELFDILCRRRSPKIKLWLARHAGELISGALCFYHNRHVAYWHSATSQHYYKKLNATHVLQYNIIKDAIEQGFLLYDFMPSSKIEGVIEFKQGFSPKQRKVQIYTSPSMQLASALRNRLRNSIAYKFVMKDTGF